MQRLKDISIKFKMVLMVVTIFIVTIGITYLIFSYNETKKQAENLKNEAMLLAKYTAEYCSAPIFFGIKEETNEILQNLEFIHGINYAAIYDKNKILFNVFNPTDTDIPKKLGDVIFDSLQTNKVSDLSKTLKSNHIVVQEQISFEGVNYGTLVIEYSLNKSKENLLKNITSAGKAALLMLVFVIILTIIFQRIITIPLSRLTSLSATVIKGSDYSLRAEKTNNDEIGLLYDGFNSMLEQIELRDRKRDHTEKMLEKARDEAERADRLKSAFLANMSHEIRTPMNSIIGFTGLINDSEITPTERTEYVELINSSCNTLLQLIDDILDISKIEAGQLSVNTSSCNLSALLHESFVAFNEMNNNNNHGQVELFLQIPPSLSNLTVNTDEIRLKQILSNLVSNAIKFTHEGNIEIGYTLIDKIKNLERKKYIKFFIHDTGIGIDLPTQEVIFERFTKIEPDNNKLYRGAGLGLTISKKLVELLGGDMWVESSPGSGSSFYFTIPAPVDTPHTAHKVIVETRFESADDLVISLSSKSLLVVEDDPSNFELLKAILKKTEINISWARNGLEAVEYCKNKTPDVILMDIKMPEMDGYEATSKLRDLNIKIPIIAQTAFARLEDESQILKSGFDGYLAKPIEKTQLIKLLDKLFN